MMIIVVWHIQMVKSLLDLTWLPMYIGGTDSIHYHYCFNIVIRLKLLQTKYIHQALPHELILQHNYYKDVRNWK